MKRKLLALLLCAAVALGVLWIGVFAAPDDAIIILYENDVHCQTEGYTKLAALKKELQQDYDHVGVVSSGDYIQGSVTGMLSKGEAIISLLNAVGYDALALGNHEFDYHLPRLEELIGMLDTKPVCCNFEKIGEEEPYFAPYSLVSYGDVKIAYVGITTPSTVTSTSPAQFKDEAGNYVFTFHPDDLYQVVQKHVDAARAEGADYVIALSHLGDTEPLYNVEELIANTADIDVFLDAHSHSVIEGRLLSNKEGEEVVLSSTGTKFQHVGKLTISEDGIRTELIETETLTATDPAVDAVLEGIDEKYVALGERGVGESRVKLVTHDEEGNRLVRRQETNLGNFCSDALRFVTEADIGYINGGGLRAELAEGEISFNDLVSIFPFSNTVVLAEIDGQTFRDMLEMAMADWPEEGSFPHVSGVTFSLNTAIPSSVALNEMEEFCGVTGPYRVYNIKIFNRETETFEPLELEKTYTIASNNYYLLEHGSGMTMLKNVKILRNDGMLDVEALELYLTDSLGGTIDSPYTQTRVGITYTDGEISEEPLEAPLPKQEEDPSFLWLFLFAVVALVAPVALILFLRRQPKNPA